MDMNPSLRCASILLLCTAACEVGVDLGQAQSDTTGGPTSAATVSDSATSPSATEPTSITSGADPTPQDLFMCTRQPEWNGCDTVFWHLSPEPFSAMQCNASLIASGQRGVLSGLRSFGPYLDESEWRIFLLGDDTALVQQRDRLCTPTGGDSCDGAEAGWILSSPRICRIGSQAALEDCFESCEDDCQCVWTPFDDDFVDCRDAEAWDCPAIDSVLSADAETGTSGRDTETGSVEDTGLMNEDTSTGPGTPPETGTETEETEETGDIENDGPPDVGCEHDAVDDCCCFFRYQYEEHYEEYDLGTSCETEVLCELQVVCDQNGDGVIDDVDQEYYSEGTVDCDASELLAFPGDEDAEAQLTCALEALANGDPGRVRYRIEDVGLPGLTDRTYHVDIGLARTAFATEHYHWDFFRSYEPALRVDLQPREYFEACAAAETFTERFACLADPYATVIDACW